MILYVLLIALLVLYFYTMTGKDLVSPQKAMDLINSGAVTAIVDVRTRTEYNIGHYPGARNIPVGEIDEESTSALPRDGAILVYCNTGQRARVAARKLRRLGFEAFYISCSFTCIM
jgi:phage shock protein E